MPASEQAVREEKLREANPNCEKLPGSRRAAEGGLQSTDSPNKWLGAEVTLPAGSVWRAAGEDAAPRNSETVLENYLKRSCVFMKF